MSVCAQSAYSEPQTEYLGDVVHGISIRPWLFMSKLGIDQTLGTNVPIKIKDTVFKHGVSTDAPSEIFVSLDGQYLSFDAMVGMQADTVGPVSFQVDLDGKKVFDSGNMTASDEARPVSLSVKRAKVMRLFVGGGSGKANWADARLVRIKEADHVDMSTFGTVKTWDPVRMDGVRFSRLEEFQADDLYRGTSLKGSKSGIYTVPASGCIGMEWSEMRRFADVGLQFAGKEIPSPEGVRVEGWVKQDIMALGEYSTWQGKWVPISGKIEQQGDTWMVRLNGKDAMVADGTYKIRWIFPNVKTPIKIRQFIANTTSRWETADVIFQAEKPSAGAIGKVELYNGAIVGADGDSLKCTWDMTTPLKLKVRYTTARPWAFDRTVIRLRLPGGSFGIAIDDLVAKDCIYVKDAGLFAVKSPAKMTLAQYKASIKGKETILERVRKMPDQSFTQAVDALYQPNQDRSPTLLSLAWDNRKMVMDRDGTVRFGGPLVLNHYQFFFRYEIKPSFGSGTKLLGDKRELDGGWMPIPKITLADGGLTYQQTTFVAPYGKPRPVDKGGPWINENPLGVTEYSVENPGDVPGEASIKLTLNEEVRPKDWKTMDIGSLTVLAYAETTPRPIDVDIQPGKIMLKASDGQILAVITTGSMKVDAKNGVVTLTGTIPAKSKVQCYAYMPVEWDIKPDDIIKMAGGEQMHDAAKTYWEKVMAPAMQIDIPDTLLKNLLYASQIHCMLASRSPKNEGTLIDPWIASQYYCSLDTESHAMLRGMDMMGQSEYARRGYEFFIGQENPAGFLAFGYTLMGTGQHLWFMDEHQRLTGDTTWWKNLSPKIDNIGEWIIRQTDKTKKVDVNGKRVPEYGLLPPGTVADWQDWGYTFSMEGYYYAGMSRVAKSLAEIGDPKAKTFGKAANQLRKDIMRSYDETQSQSPVIELRDGTWAPYSPFQIGRPGPIDTFFPNEGIGLYDVELGPHHMVDEGVIDPYSRQVGWMADYMEDVRFMESCPVAGCLPADKTEKDWFNRGGFPRSQPYYGRYPELCALRDDVKPFVRTYFNQLATMFNREDLTLYENPWASVWNKTHETGHLLQQSRMMFLMERGKELWLAPFVTNNWMKDGEVVSIKNAPSFFGPVSYQITSHTADGYIEAIVTPPTRETPKSIVIRLRHPDGKLMRSVTVNGKPWKDFDSKKEIVRLKPSKGSITVRANY